MTAASVPEAKQESSDHMVLPKRTSRTPTWSQLGFEFTQNTTFHGMRFITLPTPYFCRRILWLLLVIAVTGLFSFVLASRIQKYFNYEINVNVDIVYRKEILFPAVTICNHNFLRATRTYEEGLYDIMADEFGRLNTNGLDPSNSVDECDKYRTIKGYRVAHIDGPHRFYNFSEITADVCTQICSKWEMRREKLVCRGFIYYKEEKKCSIINGTQTQKLVIEIAHQTGIDYHDRSRCNVENNVLDIYGFDFMMATGAQDGDLPAKWKNDVREFAVMAAHRKEDMIHSCRWYGAPCTSDNFQQTVTDYGVCYTFNAGNSTNDTTVVPFYTNQTGSTYGLRLNINVEEYEYMQGPHSDAGIKVYLHPIDELPMVRDLGFAVPPGRHSLIGVKATEIINLPPPHGECGNKTLEYYDSYSWFRCHRDCETRQVVEKCRCRDIFMDPSVADGRPDYCDMKDFFDCSRPILEHVHKTDSSSPESSVIDDSEPCSCKVPCNRVIFEPIVSNAALSRLSLDRILSSSTDSLRANREKALDVQIRVDNSMFMELLETLYGVREMYEDFVDTTLKKTETMQENLIGPTANAINAIIKLFRKDFHERLFEGMDDIDIVFKPSRDSIAFLVDRTIINTKMVTFQVRNLMVYNTTMIGHLEQLLQQTIEYADSASYNLPYYYSMVTNVSATLTLLGFSPADFTFLPEILAKASSDCEGRVQNQSAISIEIRENLEELQQIVKKVKTHKIADIAAVFKEPLNVLMDKLQEYITAHDELNKLCLEMYYITVQEIREFNTFMDSEASAHVDLEYSFDYAEESKEVREDEITFQEITNGYLERGTVSKKQLQTNLSEELLNDFVSRQRTLVTKVKFRLTERLRRRVDKARADVIDWYQTLISKASTLQQFMAPGFMEARVRKMKIWQRPSEIGPIDNVTGAINFVYEGDLKNMSDWKQEEVLGSEAMTELDNIINDFFVPINSDIDQYDDELDFMEQDMTSTLKSLRNLMTEYRERDELDDNFVLKNFLQMDIYYSEKSLQKIQQIGGYGVGDLLGDVGGYMGLLLGASVVTVFEVIDLILYNWIRKCHEHNTNQIYTRQRRKRQKEYFRNMQRNGHFNDGYENGSCRRGTGFSVPLGTVTTRLDSAVVVDTGVGPQSESENRAQVAATEA